MQNKFYSVVASCLCPLFFSQVLLPSYAMELEESYEYIDSSSEEGNVIKVSDKEKNVTITESSNKEENIPEVVNMPRYSFIYKEIRCQILSAYPEPFEYIKKIIKKEHLIHYFDHEKDLKEKGKKKIKINMKNDLKINIKTELIDQSEKNSENNLENLDVTIKKIKEIVEKEKNYSFSHHMEIMNEFLSSVIFNMVEKNLVTEEINCSDIVKITQIEYLEFILKHAIAKRALSKNKGDKYSKTAQLIAFSLMYAFKHKLSLDPKVLHLVQSVRRIPTIEEKTNKVIDLDWKDNKKGSDWDVILIDDKKRLNLETVTNILLQYSPQKKESEVLFDEKSVQNFHNTKVCLSLDGGGSRGIFLITLLDILFKKLEKEFHIHDLCEVFDLFAGTSTGGILALGLTCPKHVLKEKKPVKKKKTLKDFFFKEKPPKFSHVKKVKNKDKKTFAKVVNKSQAHYSTNSLRQLYKELPNKIFTGLKLDVNIIISNKYSHEPLEEELKKTLPKNLTVKDVVKPILITSVNTTNGDNVIHTKDEGLKLWEVGRRTSAAPGYFKEYKDQYRGHTHIDGGIYQNNPSYLAYEKITKEYPDCPILFLSLGTGQQDFAPINDVNGIDGISKNVINRLLQDKSDTVENQMKTHLNGEGKDGQNYFRINTILPFPAGLDTTDSNVINYIEDLAIAASQDDECQLFERTLRNFLKYKSMLGKEDKDIN